jgi:hypothetical protein
MVGRRKREKKGIRPFSESCGILQAMRLLPLALFLSLALAARFAAFSVEPAGPQRVNLDTGVTTLPQGGVLVDNENGLRLKAGYIEYKEGAFIRARALELLSAKETFRAQSLDYSIPKQEARFTGLLFSNQDFANVRAELGHGFLSEEVLIAKGVRAEKPALTAETLVVDLRRREALAAGSFTLVDGQRTLKGTGPSARLLLRFGFGRLRAETQVPQGHRLLGYLGR